MIQKNYITPPPSRLPLHQRFENIKHLRVTDFRSIEARFHQIAHLTLSQYFTDSDSLECFLRLACEYTRSPISPKTTYYEVTKEIYLLFEKKSFAEAMTLLMSFLNPIILRYNPVMTESTHKLLITPDIRPYTIFLEDYNQVIDGLFPACRCQKLRHSNSFNYHSTLLLVLLCKELERLYDYKNSLMIKTDVDPDIIDWEYPENNPQIYNAKYKHDPEQIRESYLLLKQIFIDPYYNLWYKERGPAKPISPNPLYP